MNDVQANKYAPLLAPFKIGNVELDNRFVMGPMGMSWLTDEQSTHEWKLLIVCGALWLSGYAGMWALKWGIASVSTEENVFLDAWQNMAHRTADNAYTQNFSVWQVICKNFSYFVSSPVIFLLLGCLIAEIVLLSTEMSICGREK